MVLTSKMEIQKLESKIQKKIITDLELDVENAYRITEKLAFPRLIGSEGEKKAIEIIFEEFGNAGFNPIHRDKFKTSFYIWIVLRYMFFPIGICLVLLALSFYINSWLCLGVFLLNLYIVIKALSLATDCEIQYSKNENNNFETENIYGSVESNNPKAKVVFMAHLDTKSQTFPSHIRILIFIISAFGILIMLVAFLILSIIQLIVPFNSLVLNNILFSICVVIVIISNFNYFNKTGNKSSGAYDNAAAVGTIIELARFYKNNAKDNVDLIFLCTSSEELNLGGAKIFIQKYKNEFDKSSTYFINLDLIGGNEMIRLVTSYGIPRKISSQKLKDLFFCSAQELKIDIKDIYVPTGAWSDYMPIVQEGFEACWVGSQPGLKCVHTKKDNMNLVSKEGIKNVLLLCECVVDKINNI